MTQAALELPRSSGSVVRATQERAAEVTRHRVLVQAASNHAGAVPETSTERCHGHVHPYGLTPHTYSVPPLYVPCKVERTSVRNVFHSERKLYVRPKRNQMCFSFPTGTALFKLQSVLVLFCKMLYMCNCIHFGNTAFVSMYIK